MVLFGLLLLGLQFLRRGLRAILGMPLDIRVKHDEAKSDGVKYEAFLVIMGSLFVLMFIGLPVAFAFLVVNVVEPTCSLVAFQVCFNWSSKFQSH